MSTRVINTFDTVTNTTSVTTVTNGITTLTTGKTNSSIQLQETRTGSANPYWISQVTKGQNATTVLSGVKTTSKRSQGSWVRSELMLVNPFTFTEDACRSVTNATNPSTSLINADAALSDASSSFYRNARSAQRSFQGGTFFGELAKTIGMVRNPAKSFREGVSSFTSSVKKRTRGKGISSGSPPHQRKAAGKIIAETYLEYAYGWRPLIKDVKDGCKAMSKVLTKSSYTFEAISGKGHVDGPADVTWLDHTVIHAGIWGRVYRTSKASADAIIYGAVRIAEIPQLQGHISRQFGFTLSDAAPTAWELIPWSFLIDYFTNVGDIISAASFQRSDIAWAAQCIKRKNETFCCLNHKPHPALPNTKVIADGGSPSRSTRTYEDIQRSPIGSPPVPSFGFHLPYSNTQWTNIGALVAARQNRF